MKNAERRMALAWIMAGLFIVGSMIFEMASTYKIDRVHAGLEEVSSMREVVEPVDILEFEFEEDCELHEEIPEVRTVVEEVVEEPETRYFDIPLDEDLQDHIFMICDGYGIDPAIVVAMIQRESNFVIDIVGDNGNSFGLMQIQPRWHQDRMEKLGCTDLLNPYQNVNVGVNYLSELFEKGKSLEWVLMAYNGGPSYANKKEANGEVSTYAKDVIAESERLKGDI